MTVKELIEKLKVFDQDLPVRVMTDGDDPIDEVFDVIGFLQISLSDVDEENAVILRHN